MGLSRDDSGEVSVVVCSAFYVFGVLVDSECSSEEDERCGERVYLRVMRVQRGFGLYLCDVFRKWALGVGGLKWIIRSNQHITSINPSFHSADPQFRKSHFGFIIIFHA